MAPSELEPVRNRALSRWFTATAASGQADVMRGAAGAILAAAELVRYFPKDAPLSLASRLADRCQQHLRQQVRRATRDPVSLGFAHGLAGGLFALETAQAAFGIPVDPALREDALECFRRTRIPVPGHPSAAVWPVSTRDRRLVHGWCHGAPGIALALLGCHSLTQRPEYHELAQQGLRGILTHRNDHPSICCGVLGNANILIEAHRITGDRRWLRDARRLRRRFPADTVFRHRLCRGLWKGLPGLHYTLWRLRHPKRLPFPGLGLLSYQEVPQ